MFFKREDILKIHNALLQLGVKDSELPNAESVTYDDTLSIVQEGKNKQIGVKDFFNQISLWKKEDFINITDEYDKYNISLLEAINLVPILQRKNGLVITFQDVEGNWEIYQFRGNITEFFEKDKWFNLYDYRNYIIQSIVPDEEDLTASTPDENGNSLVHLKDRVYDSTSFSGKGYKILRKNIQSVNIANTKITITEVPSSDGTLSFTINGKETQVAVSATTDNTTALVAQKVAIALQDSMTEYDVSIDSSLITLTRKSSGSVTPSVFSASTTGVVCTITDSTKREYHNILMSNMINKPNTIYEIRYDFDLNGEDITIPENCALKFDGGSLKNGTLIWNNTIIYGNFFEHVFNIKFGSNFFAPDILYINVDMFGADPTGQIDSIEAINNAIEYVSRNKLNIPIYFTNNGVYYITDNIICRDYTTLIGNGSTFKYKWIYGIDEEYKSCTIISNYRIDATNNIRVIGGNTHISIKGFNFNIVNSLNYFDVEDLKIPNGAITFYDVDYLEISEIYYTFKNNVQPIWTEGCSHINIHDCTLIKEVKDGDTEDLDASASSGIWITNNNIRDVSDIRIHNNYIVGRRDECIAVQSKNRNTRNVYIYDNTLYNNYVMNISITPVYKGVNSVEPIIHNINIYNNRLYGGFVSLRKGQEDIKIYNNYFSNKDIYARMYSSRLAFVLIDSITSQNSINSTLNRISIFNNFIEIGQEETDSVKLYVVFIIAITKNISIYNNTVVSTSLNSFKQCIHSDGSLGLSLYNNDIRVRFSYLVYSVNNANDLIIKGNIVEALSCIIYVKLRNNIIAKNLNIVDNKINNVIGPFNFVLSNEDSGFSLTYNNICFISGNVINSGAQIKSPAKSLGNLMCANQSAIVTNAPNYIERDNIGNIKAGDVYDGKVIVFSGAEIPISLSYYFDKKYRSFDGCLYNTRRSGMFGQRPVGTSIYVGFVYFDTSLIPKRPIWASEINGDTVTWVDATGAIV